MSDYFTRRDMQSITAYTDVGAEFTFGFDANEQGIVNNTGFALLMSFDGVNDHGRLTTSGPESALAWEDHPRRQLWVRRETGTGGGAAYADIYATHR
jgi:hypothetical protein